ncbi:MAG TPA: helix-turn-helix domain-containing protein [Usitatibacter sp.]|jgi:transcriptional regulator with XRE-family HTH domain|nr:helix-turn-helix domain-containing protein [Usitatibacter sp.]
MPARPQPFFASERALLEQLGERLRAARLRRKFSAETVAQRAGVSRMTLHRMEKGDPAVTLGNYLKVLAVLHLEGDLGLLARDDELGRRLQDLELPRPRVRRPRP